MEYVYLGLLLLTVAVTFSIAPLWRLCWSLPVCSVGCFVKVKDSGGQAREAWRWVEGKTIRVYQLPHLARDYTGPIAEGVRELLDDAGLDFEVQVRPLPPTILKAYRASLREEEEHGRRQTYLSFEDFQSRLIEMRGNDPRADVLIIDVPLHKTRWAYGIGLFRSGLVVIQQSTAGKGMGKHEAGHLMGYQMHDNVPLFVFGYPWEGWPWNRDTLMILASRSTELSPRARDALRAFWEGMERRTGGTFLLSR
jgi:hypothetical protein